MCLVLTLGLIALAWASPDPAYATDTGSTPQAARIAFGNDAAAAGQSILITDEEVGGNSFIAGQNVELSGGRVGTDLFVTGQNVRVAGTEVSSAVFAAGATVNLTTAGTPEVFATGQQVDLTGTARAAHLAGNSVTLGGTVEGDVSVAAEHVTIQPGTTVNGTLKVTASEEPTIPSDATIGNYTYEPATQSTTRGIAGNRNTLVRTFLISLAGMLVLGILMLSLGTERPFAIAAKRFTTRPTLLLFGLLFLCVMPLAILILLITVIGARAALAALCLYLFAAIIATVFCAISMGRLAFGKMNPWLSTLIMVPVFAIALKVPYLGPIVGLFSLLFTFGALFVAYRDWRGGKKVKAVEGIRIQSGRGAHSAGSMTIPPSN
ncbi:MAG: hypothetical protein Q4A93_00370 [Actinomycetota bacterium]|nr:hypothetical protein [Actinomycetota bacterium]